MNNTWLIGNALRTPHTLFTLIRNVKRQKKFLQKNLHAELEAAKKSNDGSLDSSDFKKITGYYGLSVPAILGEAICVLRGNKMSLKERMALTYQGAMTGLFDDFFDKQDITDEKVRMFMEQPQHLTGNTSGERLFLEFYKKALEYCDEPDMMLKCLRKVYDAQIDSRKQALPGLTQEEIKKITLHKGGVSVLFYRSVMSHQFKKGEEEALYKMGGLMQFGNDIFDVYKDRNNGIHTLVTTATKINDLRKIFRSVMNDSFNTVWQTDYPAKNIKGFLHLISMCLCSRCFAFFDQLEKKEETTNGIFSPDQYSREDLICDMEKRQNKWRTVRYYLKYPIANIISITYLLSLSMLSNECSVLLKAFYNSHW